MGSLDDVFGSLGDFGSGSFDFGEILDKFKDLIGGLAPETPEP